MCEQEFVEKTVMELELPEKRAKRRFSECVKEDMKAGARDRC